MAPQMAPYSKWKFAFSAGFDEVRPGLSRIVTWVSRGIAYETDGRHADTRVAELGLDTSNAVGTPMAGDRSGEEGQ